MNVDLVSETLPGMKERAEDASSREGKAVKYNQLLVANLDQVARSHLYCHAVGRMAAVIKEERLYLELGYSSWEGYCKSRCPRRHDTINRYIKIAEGIKEEWLAPAMEVRLGAVYEAAIAPLPVRKLLYEAALDGAEEGLIQCARAAAQEAGAGGEASAAHAVLQKGDQRRIRRPGRPKGPHKVSHPVVARRFRAGFATLRANRVLWEGLPNDKTFSLKEEDRLALGAEALETGEYLIGLASALGVERERPAGNGGADGNGGAGGAEKFGLDEKKKESNEITERIGPNSIVPPPPPNPDPPPDPPPNPEPARAIAEKPKRVLPGQEYLPVPYPENNDEPNLVERLACGLFVLLTQAWAIAQNLEKLLRDYQALVPPLFRLQLYNQGQSYYRQADLALKVLKEALPNAERTKARILEEEPDLDPDFFLPMKLDTKLPGPLYYVKLQVSSPEFTPWSKKPELSTQATNWVLRLTALLERITGFLQILRERREEPFRDEYEPLLFAQLYTLVDQSATDLLFIANRSEDGTGVARKELEAVEQERARIREARIREEEEMVILGQRDKPRSYVKLGREIGTGRQVALTLSRPLINLAIGDKGYGKTHQGMLIAEGAQLDLPKLNRLDKGPISTVIFSTEWRKQKGNRQLVRGFWSNPDQQDMQILSDYYGFNVSRESCWTNGTLLCLPGQAERLRVELADEVRRGLRIRDLKLHSLDLQNFGFSLLCNSGAEALGKDKPRYQGFLEQSIAELGNDLTVSALEEEILNTKIDNRYKSLLLKQLRLIKLVVKDEERLGSIFEEASDPGPIFVLLEGPHLGPDILLPLQMVIVNALLQPGPDGKERPLWVVIEELTKLLANEAVHRYLCEMIYEVRHHMFSVHGSGQMSLRFQAELLTLPNVLTVFHMENREEWRRLQQQRAALAQVSFEQVYDLDIGEAWIFPQLSSDPDVERNGIHVDLRPTALDAGGETVEIE